MGSNMAIDRNLLKKLKAQPLAETKGVRDLVHSIHRAPVLREWVTLESGALAPIPVKRGNSWHLLTLLAVSTELENGDAALNPPWGAIEWVVSVGAIAQILDLRWHQPTATLRSQGIIPINPADPCVTLDSPEGTKRENALFHLLDKFFASTETVPLSYLASHYSGLLPPAIYSYYHLLIPECKEWLNPDVSAVTLPSDSPQHLGEEEKDAETSHSPESKIPPANETEYATSLLPPDLTESLDIWLPQIKSLAETLSVPEVATQLEDLDHRRHLPGFRLAFVGEFSRGKSNLINRLLDQPILPIGSLPTTATLISIQPGTEDKMEVFHPQQSSQIRPLQTSSWDDLLATDSTGTNQDIVAQVQLTLNHSWLQTLDAELIDTPGAGDLSERRATVVFDLLSACDAAILVVSATLPLSLTEIAFLEQEVIGRHISRILVVVSKLDTIPKAERSEVFEEVKLRLSKVSTAIPVLPLHSVNAEISDSGTLNAVRKQIETMVAKGERRLWRSQQVASQLIEYLNSLISVGESAISATQMSVFQKEEELQKVQAEIQTAQLYWDEIQLELEQRRLRRYQELEQRIFNSKAELLEIFTYELKKAPNPKTWWEQDLPYRFRREFLSLSRKSENFLVRGISEDLAWLLEQVANRFSQQIQTKISSSALELELPQDLDDISLNDVQQYRLFTRVGSSAAMIGSYLLGGPIGIIASTGVWLLGEKIINKTIQEQRNLLEQKLHSCVEKVISQYCRAVSERLTKLYKELTQDIQREQKIWQQAKLAIVEQKSFTQDTSRLQEMISQAVILKTEIVKKQN